MCVFCGSQIRAYGMCVCAAVGVPGLGADLLWRQNHDRLTDPRGVQASSSLITFTLQDCEAFKGGCFGS